MCTKVNDEPTKFPRNFEWVLHFSVFINVHRVLDTLYLDTFREVAKSEIQQQVLQFVQHFNQVNRCHATQMVVASVVWFAYAICRWIFKQLRNGDAVQKRNAHKIVISSRQLNKIPYATQWNDNVMRSKPASTSNCCKTTRNQSECDRESRVNRLDGRINETHSH